jgi:tricorn protease
MLNLVRLRCLGLVATALFCCAAALGAQDAGIPLLQKLRLSPDGSALVFAWQGDIWKVSAIGGVAQRLTAHAAEDMDPVFSNDGQSIAFASDRADGVQIFTMSAGGSEPEQITRHTDGQVPLQWAADDSSLLILASRDHWWDAPQRFFLQPRTGEKAPRLLFNDYGQDGRLSPDGTKLLFTRETEPVYRKRYTGAQASQLWLFDLQTGTFSQLRGGNSGTRWPQWAKDSLHYYWCEQAGGVWNLFHGSINTDERQQLTTFKDDGILFPDLSRDGKTFVWSRNFAVERFDLASGHVTPLVIKAPADHSAPATRRIHANSATEAAFTDDAREIAFVANNDLFVMDTELKEPVRVTSTPGAEKSPLFSADHDALYFTSQVDGRVDIYVASRKDSSKPWWLNRNFDVRKLTDDDAVEQDLRLDPSGKFLCYLRGQGTLVRHEIATAKETVLLSSFSAPEYDFSPDSKWIAYAIEDEEFNSDIWIAPVDGSKPPFNLSCHPDNDRSPRWSPDGKILAFIGRRFGEESDIMWVHLSRAGEEESSRDRTLEKALKKMEGRKAATKEPAKEPAKSTELAAQKEPDPAKEPSKESPERERRGGKRGSEEAKSPSESKEPPKDVQVDFEGLRERLKRIPLSDSQESQLSWMPNGKKLCFNGTVNGKSSSYVVEFPDLETPKELGAPLLSRGRWLKDGEQMAGLSNAPSPLSGAPRMGRGGGGGSGGTPALLSSSGKLTSFAFRVETTLEVGARNAALLDQAWTVMRDRWYDEKLGNNDWNAIRARYEPVAHRCSTAEELSRLANMMLGELNGSHCGFTFSENTSDGPSSWRLVTGHLGARFDPNHTGEGWKVKDVISKSPAASKESLLLAGDVVLSVDGTPLTADLDPARVLTGVHDRDVTLSVRGTDSATRTVVLRPTTNAAMRQRLYEDWMDSNRAAVDKLSDGHLGYLHIAGMGDANLLRFEEELYRAGNGKEGLIIDVRENGGGSITDHLLTCLTQPHHAVTVPRGGSPGYPQDRRIYATWQKPIAVLCNQNSFSNAEIFAHSIKTLGRGKVIGVPTAGGVISTGGASLMDGAFVRVPGRGWYTLDGEDMELHGCVPDIELWPVPGEMPAGQDRQLEAAVKALTADVVQWRLRPQPKLRKATDR